MCIGVSEPVDVTFHNSSVATPGVKHRDILVTGGAGFIGGHLAETFAENGHDVVVFDHFEPYYDLGIKEHNVEVGQSAAARSDGSYEFVRGSTTDADLVNDLVTQADVVYHQAAPTSTRTFNIRKKRT